MNDAAFRIRKLSLFPRQKSMGPSLWEARREGATNTAHPGSRTHAHFAKDVYEWQLAGPFETRMRLPAVPMPSLVESPRAPMPTVSKRRNGRQTRRKEHHILEWLYRDDLSSPKPIPKHAFKSPVNKLKPLGRGSVSSPEFQRLPPAETKSTGKASPQLPRISFESVLSNRKPQPRRTRHENNIYHKEVNFTPPGHRRYQNLYANSHLLRYPQWSLEAVSHKQNVLKQASMRSRLDPLPVDPATKLAPQPPPPPPQSLNTLPQSKAPSNNDDLSPTAADDEGRPVAPQMGWDPRRHYLQAHFRGIDSSREEDLSNLPCDLRDPNDSFAYNDVIEYMLDNDLMSMSKLRRISKWIDETLPPGFIYDEQRAWFVAIDPEERKSISNLSSISHNT